MSRCGDKRFSVGGLNIPSGSRCVVDGEERVVVCGRRKPLDGEVHAKELASLVAAGSSVVIDLPVQADARPGAAAPTLAVTPSMLEGPQGAEALGVTLALLGETYDPNTVALIAKNQLLSLHLKSVDGGSAGRSRAASKVLDSYLPSGFVSAVTAASGASSNLAKIRGPVSVPELAEVHSAVSPDRLGSARDLARVEGWRSVLLRDPRAALLCPEAVEGLSPAMWMGMYCSVTERPLVNLTPHDVTICDESGRAERTYPSAGVARARQDDEVIGSLYGVPLVRSSFGEPQGFPDEINDPADPTCYVVSKITADAAVAAGLPAEKLVLTSSPVFDASRQIIGVKQFATAPNQRVVADDRGGSEVPSDAVLVNMTPREIVFADPESGAQIFSVPPSGTQALASSSEVPVGTLHGQSLMEVTFGAIQNLPEPAPGVFYIVSAIAAAAAPDRTDLLLTSNPIRNDAGQIVASGALARP